MARHKIAPNDTASVVQLQENIFKWNYEKSVTRMQSKISKWNTLSAEIYRELYLAREFLNNQKGQRKDPTAEDYIAYTWDDYCQAIGISRRTANNYLRLFIPAEISESGEDTVLTAEEFALMKSEERQKDMEAQEERQKDMEAQEERLALFFKNGVRPEGWIAADEHALKTRLIEQQAKETARVWSGKAALTIKPKRDYFAEILEKATDIKRFALKDAEQNTLQLHAFDAIDEYLRSFGEVTDRLTAACNLSIKLREAVNYYTELDMLQSEQAEMAQ